MRWVLRDGAREFALLDARQKPSAEERVIGDAAQVSDLLQRLCHDPTNMDALRRAHADLVGAMNSRSRTHLLVVAELVDVVATGRLRLVDRTRHDPVDRATPRAEAAQDLAEAEPLHPEPPPPEPEAAPSPLVVAQVAALRRAAEVGAPLCEE